MCFFRINKMFSLFICFFLLANVYLSSVLQASNKHVSLYLSTRRKLKPSDISHRDVTHYHLFLSSYYFLRYNFIMFNMGTSILTSRLRVLELIYFFTRGCGPISKMDFLVSDALSNEAMEPFGFFFLSLLVQSFLVLRF